jgi:hypothetical protein
VKNSWGKLQTWETADDLKRHANEMLDSWNARFEGAKQKVAEKGEDIKQRAGKQYPASTSRACNMG